MTDWNTTSIYFLEPVSKMKPLLSNLLYEEEKKDSKEKVFKPSSLLEIPEKEYSFQKKMDKEEIENWMWRRWGFNRFTMFSYFLYDNFSVVEFENNGDASPLFMKFAVENNIRYFSKTFMISEMLENFFYFDKLRNKVKISFNNNAYGEFNFSLFNLFDFKKIGLMDNFSEIMSNHSERNGLIFCEGDSFFTDSVLREEEYESEAWKSLHLLTNTVENLDESKPFIREVGDSGW